MKRSFFQYVSLNVLGALGLSGYILADTLFVAHRLAPLEAVQSTTTHFVLKKYKYHGVILVGDEKDEREVTSL